jgi:hypothetical protein
VPEHRPDAIRIEVHLGRTSPVNGPVTQDDIDRDGDGRRVLEDLMASLRDIGHPIGQLARAGRCVLDAALLAAELQRTPAFVG